MSKACWVCGCRRLVGCVGLKASRVCVSMAYRVCGCGCRMLVEFVGVEGL